MRPSIRGHHPLYLLIYISVILSSSRAQNDTSQIWELVKPAPEKVFHMFQEAGMSPVDHVLSHAEFQIVDNVFSKLPLGYQEILKKHLHSISFMDNMPNTALTSPVDTVNGVKRYHIVFRAAILNQTISEWSTWKENSYYNTDDSSYRINVEAGDSDALLYVMLHETAHVVHNVLDITPQVDEPNDVVPPTAFTAGIWKTMSLPMEDATSPVLERTRFRSGNSISISLAPQVYKGLAHTPFVSLYGMASWYEDYAELSTIYYLTQKLKQPYKVVVSKDDVAVQVYEPFKNDKVNSRIIKINKSLAF